MQYVLSYIKYVLNECDWSSDVCSSDLVVIFINYLDSTVNLRVIDWLDELVCYVLIIRCV